MILPIDPPPEPSPLSSGHPSERLSRALMQEVERFPCWEHDSHLAAHAVCVSAVSLMVWYEAAALDLSALFARAVSVATQLEVPPPAIGRALLAVEYHGHQLEHPGEEAPLDPILFLAYLGLLAGEEPVALDSVRVGQTLQRSGMLPPATDPVEDLCYWRIGPLSTLTESAALVGERLAPEPYFCSQFNNLLDSPNLDIESAVLGLGLPLVDDAATVLFVSSTL